MNTATYFSKILTLTHARLGSFHFSSHFLLSGSNQPLLSQGSQHATLQLSQLEVLSTKIPGHQQPFAQQKEISMKKTGYTIGIISLKMKEAVGF